MEWFFENWQAILAAITGLVTSASIIAKLTPTEVDDKWVANLLRLVDLVAINNKPTVKK